MNCVSNIADASDMEGGLLLTVYTYGRYESGLWCRVKSRSNNTCAQTGQPIKSGDLVYRPVTNKGHRGMRILASALENK